MGNIILTNIPIAEDEAIQWIKEAKKRNIKNDCDKKSEISEH